MNETKHTPGPWQVRWDYQHRTAEIETVSQTFSVERGGYRHITNDMPMCAGPNCDEVVVLTDPEDGREYKYSAEAVANAQLISAAPELFERLQWALARIKALEQKYSNESLCSEAFKLAEAALAKAEGR